jgi:hypothetical protein
MHAERRDEGFRSEHKNMRTVAEGERLKRDGAPRSIPRSAREPIAVVAGGVVRGVAGVAVVEALVSGGVGFVHFGDGGGRVRGSLRLPRLLLALLVRHLDRQPKVDDADLERDASGARLQCASMPPAHARGRSTRRCSTRLRAVERHGVVHDAEVVLRRK